MVGILTMAHGLPVTGCSQGADTLTHAQGFSKFHKHISSLILLLDLFRCRASRYFLVTVDRISSAIFIGRFMLDVNTGAEIKLTSPSSARMATASVEKSRRCPRPSRGLDQECLVFSRSHSNDRQVHEVLMTRRFLQRVDDFVFRQVEFSGFTPCLIVS